MYYDKLYFRTFKAHGTVFHNPDEAEARIKEINEEIFKWGLSDGRLTEWLLIEEALEKAVKDAQERRQAAEHAEWKLKAIRETESELRTLQSRLDGKREEGAGYPIHRITWFDKEGRRHVSRYSTDTGYLKAYLRMVKSDISIWDAI